MPTIATSRLLLRPWRDSDLPAFAVLNADPRVMEFFPKLLDRSESDRAAAAIRESGASRGFGLWAVEIPNAAPFIGFVGLSMPRFESHFTPCVEIGWRLAFEHWNHGFATEAAQAAVRFAFEQLELDELVSFTVPANRRSRRVMERLGMSHDPADDFDHPALPPGHPICRHVLYRLPRHRSDCAGEQPSAEPPHDR
ncbi:MAG TPA: GNAT family N-acetyltransferase [Pirellulales bacterium]|jgi:RimJ/RimL family protein N-acetyltransferase|nr:GNAT family N-acetyltransferase [Pirellulales bacterium]